MEVGGAVGVARYGAVRTANIPIELAQGLPPSRRYLDLRQSESGQRLKERYLWENSD